jgi:hypothetical protein
MARFASFMEGRMTKINTGRVVLGGVVAGIIMFFGDGILHETLLGERWAQVMAGLGRSKGHGSEGMPYFAAYDLLKGLAAVWTYAAIRPRFGAGARTALFAGAITWLLTIPVPLLGLIPMNFFGRRLPALWSIYGIIPMLIAAIVGAWLYREEGSPAPVRPSV